MVVTHQNEGKYLNLEAIRWRHKSAQEQPPVFLTEKDILSFIAPGQDMIVSPLILYPHNRLAKILYHQELFIRRVVHPNSQIQI